MQPDYLLPELECGEDGAGPIVETIPTQCVLTLGITQVTEREGLEVSIWGSEDGENWGSRPLAEFPPKSYCGRYSLTVDLRDMPKVRRLRAAWKLKSWVRAQRDSRFGFWVKLSESEHAGARTLAAGA